MYSHIIKIYLKTFNITYLNNVYIYILMIKYTFGTPSFYA